MSNEPQLIIDTETLAITWGMVTNHSISLEVDKRNAESLTMQIWGKGRYLRYGKRMENGAAIIRYREDALSVLKNIVQRLEKETTNEKENPNKE